MGLTCAQARALLAFECEAVREQAGDVALPVYDTLWNECVKDICFVPSQHRYGRAALLSQRERVESLERELQVCPCECVRVCMDGDVDAYAGSHGAACQRRVQAR